MDLPSGYTQLEYIESTGTQYIDTGFKPNQDTRVVMNAQMTEISGAAWYFGTRATGYIDAFGVLYSTSAKAMRSAYGEENLTFATTNYTARVAIDKNKTSCKLGDETLTHAAATFQSPHNMYLFANNEFGVVSEGSETRLYSCHIYDNGTLIRDYIPCVTADGQVGLYDTVNALFYGNAGSGDFLRGAEITPDPITPTEFPSMVYDRTYSDLARAKELAAIGYASMTDAEREEWDNGLRGAYNAIDFNRVENAVLYLFGELKDLPQELRDYAAELKVWFDSFFDITYPVDALNLTTKNTWKLGEIPSKEEKSRYLSNVVELRQMLDYETDKLPPSMDGLTIDGANAIEKALAFLHAEIDKFRQMRKTQIENTAAAWFYAEEIYANEV